MNFYLRNALLNDWQQAASAAGIVPDYGDPRLLTALERLDGIDFTEYGLEPREENGEEEGFFGMGYSSGDEGVLVRLNEDICFEEYYSTKGTLLALGFGEDLPGVLPLNMTAAFVNPYSAHPEAAVALVEALLEAMPDPMRYNLCADIDEPLVNPWYEIQLADYRDTLKALQVELDVAEPADRQAIQEALELTENSLKRFETEGHYIISPEQLAAYHALGERLTVSVPSWFEKDDSGEAWQLRRQYEQGLIPAREFLAAVNQKARMMALEAE